MYSFVATFLGKKFNFDAHYFLKGGFWLSLTQVITILAGLATTSLFAHYLSETEYGIYRYLLGLAILFSSLSLTGLGQSILQTAAKKYYGFYKETLVLNLKYSLGIAVLSTAGGIYYILNHNLTLALGCFLIALFQPFITGYQNTTVFLQGSRRFKASTVATTSKIIFISATSIVALLLTKNILVLVAVYLASSALINFLLHLWYRPKATTPTPEAVTTQYLSFAKHTSVRNTVATVSNRLDTVLIFTQLGAAELAIYTIATTIPEQIKGSFKNLTSLLLPKYANHENFDIVKKSVPKRSLQLFFILLAITVLYIFIAPYLYQLLFPKYEEAVFYSQLLALSFVTFVLYIPLSIIQTKTAEKELHEITLYGSIFQVVSIVLCIHFFGLIGAIIAKILYRVFQLVLSFRLLNKFKNDK